MHVGGGRFTLPAMLRHPAARLAALLSLIAAAAACTSPTTYHRIAIGDPVRYYAGRAAPAPDWNTPEFDDSGWSRGATFAGTGPSVETRIDGLGTDLATVYVRARFDAGPRAAATTRLKVSPPVFGDAGYVLYVNGIEVARDVPGDLVVNVPAGTLRPLGNVAAVEVHAAPAAAEIAIGFNLDTETPAASTVAGLVRGPYVQAVGPTSATVVFDTGKATAARVSVDGRVFESPSGTHHEVAVSGLAPSKSYAYRVEAAGVESEPFELATAPIAGEPVSFVVYGDTRTNGDEQRRIVAAIAAEGVDAAINTGDLVDEGSAAEWEAFFEIEYALLSRIALYPAVGNHELNGSGGADTFRRTFVLPSPIGSPSAERVYSFDVGDVHFAALDSNLDLLPQAAWLDADLAAARARGARHLFVYMHHGPWSAGSEHGGSGAARQHIAPVARRHGVDALFAGHDHIYERGAVDGFRYFVTGGGGAPLIGWERLASTLQVDSRYHYLVVRCAAGSCKVEAKDSAGIVFDSVEW